MKCLEHVIQLPLPQPSRHVSCLSDSPLQSGCSYVRIFFRTWASYWNFAWACYLLVKSQQAMSDVADVDNVTRNEK
eukprot:scaffold158230_cov23-Tisochrysis_lutea.AAC.3